MKRLKENIEEIQQIVIGGEVFTAVKYKDKGDISLLSLEDTVSNCFEEVDNTTLEKEEPSRALNEPILNPKILDFIDKATLLKEIKKFIENIKSYEKDNKEDKD